MNKGKTVEDISLGIIAKKTNAIKPVGHHVLSSGLHSEYYIDKWEIFCRPTITNSLCAMIANKVIERCTGRGTNADIWAVCGPADGGNIMALHTAGALMLLQKWNDIFYLHTTKEGNGFVFKQGYEKIIEGKEILVTEDMLTTAGQAVKLMKKVEEFGGKVIALATLWNRGEVRPEDIGTEIISLINKKIPSWPATPERPCKLCLEGRPINTEFGHGKEFLEKLKNAK